MHADTWCVGYHTLILKEYDRTVAVYGYDTILGSQTFCTVYDIMAYTDFMTGSIYHLVIHQ